MIGQMRTLLRVKELKEEQAFRALQQKRGELKDAETAVVEADRIVRESAASLPAREAECFAVVLGQIVDLNALDDVRAKVVQLQKAHLALIDALDSARAAVQRITDEVAAALSHFRLQQKNRDKYVILTDAMAVEVAAIAEQREEVDIEDLFGVRRKRLA